LGFDDEHCSTVTLIIAYLIGWLFLIGWLGSIDLKGLLPIWIAPFSLAYKCSLLAALGGVLYSLRAVYLNRCVRKSWDNDWIVWYLIRPIVSLIVGLIAFVFLKAGLLVLDAKQDIASPAYGFLALAFIAGLNVDRFLVRLEELARSTWGIRPSRTSENSESISPNEKK